MNFKRFSNSNHQISSPLVHNVLHIKNSRIGRSIISYQIKRYAPSYIVNSNMYSEPSAKNMLPVKTSKGNCNRCSNKGKYLIMGEELCSNCKGIGTINGSDLCSSLNIILCPVCDGRKQIMFCRYKNCECC